MSKQVDYYFTSLSPYTYLGHTVFLELTNETQTSIRFKPVILGQVFADSGALPLAQRPKSRQAYRLVEIQRWAKKRDLPINLHPAFFPTDPSLADKCVIAIQESGNDASTFLGSVLAACWAEDKNISDETVIRDILTSLDFAADKIIMQAQSEQTANIYQQNTDEAIQQGVLGAPSYVLNNEQFWGQDRLELLSDSLR